MQVQDSSQGSTDRKAYGFVLLLLVAFGACLRLWHLGSQIPLDDEWHAIAYVLDHDFGFLLGRATRLGANSVPHNLYLRAALRSVGLSEWSVALPSLVAGILLLWHYPRWVRQRFGAEAALLSGAVLALAPFLIFYSRFARPYAPLLLLEFLAIASLGNWLRTGQRRPAVAAAAFGVCAIWVHATALPPLLAAWTVAGLLQWRQHRQAEPCGPGPKQVAKVGCILFALAGSLTTFWYIRQANPAGGAASPYSGRTFLALVQLLCGTSSAVVQVLFVGLALSGLVLAARRAPREVSLFGAAAVAAVAAVLVGHPLQSEVGAIFARYAMPIFLLPAVAIGVAGQALVSLVRARRLRRVVEASLLVGLTAIFYLSGPLPYLYVGAASFTKHPAFQYDYADFDGMCSKPNPVAEGQPAMCRPQLHPFYETLAQEGGDAPIVEYPFVCGQGYNRLYLAQAVHRRPVLAGYYDSGATWLDGFGLALDDERKVSVAEPSRGYLVEDMTVDHVLGPMSRRPGLAFATLVDIADVDAVRRHRAEYVLLHWNLPREFFNMIERKHQGPESMRFVARIRDRLTTTFGKPIVDDGILTVFRVGR
jgi:hypothetical protein